MTAGVSLSYSEGGNIATPANVAPVRSAEDDVKRKDIRDLLELLQETTMEPGVQRDVMTRLLMLKASLAASASSSSSTISPEDMRQREIAELEK